MTGKRLSLLPAMPDQAAAPAVHLGRAIPLYEQTVVDFIRVLGTDHPKTKIVGDNLAAARQHR